MKDFWKKAGILFLTAVLLAMPAYAETITVEPVVPTVCAHVDVSTEGVCQNPLCGAQALARFESANTVEYIFLLNNLRWKTINMNNNNTDDIYTITILTDIPSISFTILADTVTLDLNGFTLGYTGGDFGNIVYLEEQGNLTIIDSSEEGTGAMTNPTGPVVDFARAPMAPESQAVLTIQGGTFSGQSMTFWLGGGTLYVEGGTVIGDFQAGAGEITGGRFSMDPTAALTADYKAELEDGYYVVKRVTPLVCSHDTVDANGKCQTRGCGAQAYAKLETADTVEYLFEANSLSQKVSALQQNGVKDTFTITVLQDIVSPAGNSWLNLWSEETVTLDLNGFNIRYGGSDFGHILYLSGPVNLTLMDSSASGTGSMTNETGPIADFPRAGVALPPSNSVVTVKSGTYRGGGITFWMNDGTLNVEGGLVLQNYRASAYNITGGRFEVDPTEYLAAGYEAVQDEEGYYAVQKNADSVLYGDYNDDGAINGKDLTLIRRYLSGGFDVSTCNSAAADVNLDGDINGKDLTLIRRYLSGGFDVVLGQPTGE